VGRFVKFHQEHLGGEKPRFPCLDFCKQCTTDQQYNPQYKSRANHPFPRERQEGNIFFLHAFEPRKSGKKGATCGSRTRSHPNDLVKHPAPRSQWLGCLPVEVASICLRHPTFSFLSMDGPNSGLYPCACGNLAITRTSASAQARQRVWGNKTGCTCFPVSPMHTLLSRFGGPLVESKAIVQIMAHPGRPKHSLFYVPLSIVRGHPMLWKTLVESFINDSDILGLTGAQCRHRRTSWQMLALCPL
jgi:hypothetical protein